MESVAAISASARDLATALIPLAREPVGEERDECITDLLFNQPELVRYVTTILLATMVGKLIDPAEMRESLLHWEATGGRES